MCRSDSGPNGQQERLLGPCMLAQKPTLPPFRLTNVGLTPRTGTNITVVRRAVAISKTADFTGDT